MKHIILLNNMGNKHSLVMKFGQFMYNYKIIFLSNDAFLNFVVNQEKCIDTIFKNLVDSNSISKQMYKSIKPVGARPGTVYGLCKVHKQEVDGCPPLDQCC